MPKFLISLMLLGSVNALGQPIYVAPGMRLSSEVRIGSDLLGPVVAAVGTVIPQGSGYVAYVNVTDGLISVPIHADGTTDLAARRDLGPQSLVAIAAGRPLLFWFEDGDVLAARLNGGGTRTPPVTVDAHAGLQAAVCDDSGCLVIVREQVASPSVIITDTEGHPLTRPEVLTSFSNGLDAGAMAADSTGFTLLRGGGNFVAPRIVRVDRNGHILYDVPVLNGGLTGGQLVSAGDHTVLISPPATYSADHYSAFDITSAGVAAARDLPLPTSVAIAFERRHTGNFLLAATQNGHATIYRVDANVTQFVVIDDFDLPSGATAIKDIVSNGFSTIAIVKMTEPLYAMPLARGATPSLLSYGVVPQTPVGVARLGGEFLALWAQAGVVRGSVISTDGAVVNEFALPGLPAQVLSVTSVGSDALVIWLGTSRSGAEIIHLDGSVIPVDLPDRFWYKVVETANDWVLFSNDSVVRVSRSGMVSPAKTIKPGLAAAATDGNKFLLVYPGETIVLSSQLEIEQRHTVQVSGSGTMAWSVDSYLYAPGSGYYRFTRDGDLRSTTPTAGYAQPTIIPRANGWLLVTSVSVTPVSLTDPPVRGQSIDLPTGGGYVSSGNPFGILYLRDSRVYFRTLAFVDGNRRRSVVSR